MKRTITKKIAKRTTTPRTTAAGRNQKPRPLSKGDMDRWVKWWDFEKPDSTIDPRLRTVHKGIALLLIHHYDGRYGKAIKDVDTFSWSTIAALATKAEGSQTHILKDNVVWAGIVADWAFHCAAPAWLSLLPKGVSPRYDGGLLPDRESWWASGVVENMSDLVAIMGDIERSRRATTAERAQLLNTIHHQLMEVLVIGSDALAHILGRGNRDGRMPHFYHLTKLLPGETNPDVIDLTKRLAATLPEMLELVVTTRAGDALEYVSKRCSEWPDLTKPASKAKGRKAA